MGRGARPLRRRQPNRFHIKMRMEGDVIKIAGYKLGNYLTENVNRTDVDGAERLQKT